jgi:hypothetical protein
MNDVSKIRLSNNASDEFSKKIVLKINGDIYNDSFDLEVVIEAEALLNIVLYDFISEKNLEGLSVEVLIDDSCFFNGLILRANLSHNLKDKRMVANLKCKQEFSSLEVIKKSKILNKGTILSDVIPSNLTKDIVLTDDLILLEHDTLGKLNTLKEELNLPYFSIAKDKVNFVDFSAKKNKVKNIIKAIVNKTVDNFEHLQIITEFNDGVSVGDVIVYDDNLYAIETVVYSWNHNQGLLQEIHAINNDLHKARYLR